MLTLKLKTDNDAFKPNPNFEAARLLRVAADKINIGYQSGLLRDANGNTVAEWEITHDEA